MDHSDVRAKHGQAFMQEIADELNKRGFIMEPPVAQSYFRCLRGRFRGASVLVLLSAGLKTIKVQWGPVVFPGQLHTSFLMVGSTSYDVLTQKLLKLMNQLPTSTLIDQAAVEFDIYHSRNKPWIQAQFKAYQPGDSFNFVAYPFICKITVSKGLLDFINQVGSEESKQFESQFK